MGEAEFKNTLDTSSQRPAPIPSLNEIPLSPKESSFAKFTSPERVLGSLERPPVTADAERREMEYKYEVMLKRVTSEYKKSIKINEQFGDQL